MDLCPLDERVHTASVFMLRGFPLEDARSSPTRIREIDRGGKFKIAEGLGRRIGSGGSGVSCERVRRPRNNDVTVRSDGAVDDLMLTDSHLLLVASALFISPILPWTLRSSILAPWYVTTSARSPLCTARKSCRACLPVSDVQRHSSVPRRRSFKMRRPRGPPHHPRAQHENVTRTNSPARAATSERITAFSKSHKHSQRRRRRPSTNSTRHDLASSFPPRTFPCVVHPTTVGLFVEIAETRVVSLARYSSRACAPSSVCPPPLRLPHLARRALLTASANRILEPPIMWLLSLRQKNMKTDKFRR